LFLRQGYQGTSMDEIAALAAVSKQTVYKNFADKERLFTDIVLGALEDVSAPFLARIHALADTADLDTDLRALARGYLTSVSRPQVLQLRRLVIGEATRLTELARTYYDAAPERTLAELADCFAALAGRGLLTVPDPTLAAGHFAFLVLGRTLDRALFRGDDAVGTATDRDALADAAVTVFLAAYGR
jgi:TetR/AcrR family transcriptional repressor of mexJK operon